MRGTGGQGESGRGARAAEPRNRAAVPTAAAQLFSITRREQVFGREHRLPRQRNRSTLSGTQTPAWRGLLCGQGRSRGPALGLEPGPRNPTGSRAGLGRFWAGQRDVVGIGGPLSWSAHRD